MKNINIIASVSKNGIIGKDNDMPWKQSDDLKRFKDLTIGHIVIMGKRTFQSIGSPLVGRVNIILTNDKKFNVFGCYVSSSIENALELAYEIIDEGLYNVKDDIFVIGGGQIYKQLINISNKLYITRIDCEIEGDTYFPEIKNWKLVSKEIHEKDEKNEYNYTYENYER